MGHETTDPAQAAVPLGGLGAGCVEADRSGRFRNITINNNRTPESRLPGSPYSFLALRVARPGQTYCAVLQEQGDDDALIEPAERLPKGSLHSRLLYPAVHYRLTDARCPVKALWTAFAPIIPYDHEASVLPVFLLSIRIANSSDEALDVACLLNWENLSGRDAQREPDVLPRVRPVVVEDPDESKHSVEPRAIGRRPAAEEPPPLEATPRFNALCFEPEDGYHHNADAQYCLAVKMLEKTQVQCVGWDATDAVERDRLWTHFQERGHLELFLPGRERATAGAVCMSLRLEPGAERRIDFALSWYAPCYVVGGAALGNAYTNRFASAMAVAQNALQYAAYYYASVNNWQQRLIESGVPAWLSSLMINHCVVLSTNTLYAKSGAFALVESPGHPATADSVSAFYGGFALLLLFPRFQETELALVGESILGESDGRVPLRLGMGNLQNPAHATPPDVAAGARFVLAVCRNYVLTGNLVRAREIFPAVHRALESLLLHDRDQDMLPEPAGMERTPDGLQVPALPVASASLWVAALHAAARLSDSLQRAEEATRWGRLAREAGASFERRYWDEGRGYYRLYPAPVNGGQGDMARSETCHAAQLAGQWYADFLGLGTLFDPKHMQRALAAITHHNTRPHGVSAAALPTDASAGAAPISAISDPAYAAAYFSSVQMTRGLTDLALNQLETSSRTLQKAGHATRCWPQHWDSVHGNDASIPQERHTGVLAVWHVYYAMQGLLLDQAHHRLRVAPNLPGGMHSFNSVIITPACLGWLKYQEDRSKGYRQRVRAAFDSPVNIDEIELRLPLDVGRFTVVVEVTEGPVEVVMSTQPVPGAQQLRIRPRRPMMATRAVDILVTEVTEAS